MLFHAIYRMVWYTEADMISKIDLDNELQGRARETLSTMRRGRMGLA